MTLRARLTIWYTAVLASAVLLFGGTLYIVLNLGLTSQIEHNLEQTADEILETLDEGLPQDVTITLRALDLSTAVMMQILAPDGSVVWQSMNAPAGGRPLDPERIGADRNIFSSQTLEGIEYRVLTTPVLAAPTEQLVGYLQLGASMETIQRANQTLAVSMAVGGVLAVVLAAIVGYMVSGAALRPIDEITETALSITRADDLSQRIPQMGPPMGEVGHLIQAFNETLERLEGLFEAQRRFMADVSHELRTPLTAIRGNVDLIRQTGVADEESLDAITSEVERMTRLVQDLLLLARAETGVLPLAQENVELDTIMLEVFRHAKVLAPEGVKVSIGREDQAIVVGDPDRLKQVLLNLVANAIEHTPVGGSVRLDLACVDGEAHLRVTDTGAGIPEEELPQIFERFYRHDRSRTRKGDGGTGLGLSIAYWIARAHGGRIEVESEVGKGSTFTLVLPLKRTAGEGTPPERGSTNA